MLSNFGPKPFIQNENYRYIRFRKRDLKMIIRFAEIKDAAEILQIYRPFIENSAASFETIVPTVEEFGSRIINYTQKYPWLVAEIDNCIAGYAYAGKHREREAYQWAVEVSVYVHPHFYRQGIARILYEKLFELLNEMGVVNVYAVIALPNAASVALHTSFGFERVCIYKKAGYKNGVWHDVLWLVKYINVHKDNPAPLKSIDEVKHLLQE